MNFKLKKNPEDFYVLESLVLPVTNKEGDSYHYYLLTKKNVSTFDAMRILSEKFNFGEEKIKYAGLKDEDGVTTQNISTPVELFPSSSVELTSADLNINDSFIKVCKLGCGKTEVKIGSLIGNNFRIIVREITDSLERYLKQKRKFTDFFINYYGPQRFGLPNQEKNTHIIGKLIKEKQYAEALNLLAKEDSFIGEKAKNYSSPAAQFFFEIDERQCAFFLNSFESFRWNEKLKCLLINQFHDNCYSSKDSGIDYLYSRNSNNLTKLFEIQPTLPYNKTFISNRTKQEVVNERDTIIQVIISCHRVFTDAENKKCCELSFFLPSGSYATMAVAQVLNNLQLKSVLKTVGSKESCYEKVCN